jgi:hypothetical protein
MRPAIRLAASLAPGTAQSSAAAATLIPPLALYRRILRAHRGLPAEQRVLGDAYVKEEFRRHRAVENPLHIVRSTPAIFDVFGKQRNRLTGFGRIGGISVRVGALCAAGRGVAVARRQARPGQARQDEWCERFP